jgi:predicted peroxiredoxin
MAKLMINCSHGEDDPERATLAFITGNVAESADQDTIIFLTIDGVWLATKGYAERIHKEGFQALSGVMRSFLDNGGQIWACGTCTKPRGITDADLIAGAKIVTAASVIEQIVAGTPSMYF